MTKQVRTDLEGLQIRPMGVEDHKFVFKCFYRSLRGLPEYKHMIPMTLFARLWERFLKVVDTGVIILAVSAEDPTYIVGFVMATPVQNAVHFVYVRKSFRRLGLATELLRPFPNAVWTHYTQSLGVMKTPTVTFDPFFWDMYDRSEPAQSVSSES